MSKSSSNNANPRGHPGLGVSGSLTGAPVDLGAAVTLVRA